MATKIRLTIQGLLIRLRAKDACTRYEAAIELGRRPREAGVAVSSLIAALDDRESYWVQVQRGREDWSEHRYVREAAMHALACIDPDSPITGVRAGELVVELLCKKRASSRTNVETWAEYWSGEGIVRIKPFGLPVRRALASASASKEVAVLVAACRVLAAWDRPDAEEGRS
jgi:hypothetical protein